MRKFKVGIEKDAIEPESVTNVTIDLFKRYARQTPPKPVYLLASSCACLSKFKDVPPFLAPCAVPVSPSRRPLTNAPPASPKKVPLPFLPVSHWQLVRNAGLVRLNLI